MVVTTDRLGRLGEYFDPSELEWRLQQADEKNNRIWGIAVVYVTNRAIQQRLDEVVGPENWQNEFRVGPGGGVLCGISIRVSREDGNAEWITKWDGAENTDIEEVKGGLSNSMKRAAVQWNIGRYLYQLDETFVEVAENGEYRGKTKGGKSFKWNAPKIPAKFLPQPQKSEGEQAQRVLRYIEESRPSVTEDMVMTMADGRTVVSIGQIIAERWADLETSPRFAKAVAMAIRKQLPTEG